MTLIKTMLALAAILILTPEPAAAYVGPGTGLAVIGAALAFVASIVLGVIGFIWYPFKRAYRAIFKRNQPPTDQISK